MMYQLRLGAGFTPRAALLWSLVLLTVGTGSAALAGPAKLPLQVDALYKVSFGLLGEIGSFRFRSNVDGEDYSLTANAEIDTAVFDYLGAMTATGSVQAPVAKPHRYRFGYKQKAIFGKKKKRSLSISFKGTGVADVEFVPPEDRSKKVVPVTPEQLKDVLDPLSGVMALSMGDMDRPCDQKLPIFDGKQRFDLIFRPTRRPRDAAADPADHVCRVRLVAISGHRKGQGPDSVVNGPIEVVMRAVPKANIIVPYRVTVPTFIGDAVLASQQIDITMPDRKRIALRR